MCGRDKPRWILGGSSDAGKEYVHRGGRKGETGATAGGPADGHPAVFGVRPFFSTPRARITGAAISARGIIGGGPLSASACAVRIKGMSAAIRQRGWKARRSNE